MCWHYANIEKFSKNEEAVPLSENPEQWVEELMRLNDTDETMTDKQVRIIQAAVETFAKKGYAASSTSEIAKKAGVAEGTIFRHYKTKKDLLISIVAPTVTKFIAPFVIKGFQNVFNQSYPSYEAFLRAMIINRQQFVKNNMHIIKILLQEIPFQPELREQFEKNVAVHIFDRVKKIVEHFQQKNDIISIPSPTVLRLTSSTIMGFFMIRYLFMPNHEWDDEQEIEHTIQFILHGLSASDH